MNAKRALLLALVLAGCDDEAGDSRSDAATGQTPYTLCDGSDDVRVSLVSAGGGPLPDDYAFSYPYGWRFLHVDGRCNFVASGASKGQLLAGTFSAEQGRMLGEGLGLQRTRGVLYHPHGGCPDAPSMIVTTPDARLVSGCGDEPPAQIAAAFAWDAALALATSLGTPSTGPVSMVALPSDVVLDSATLWTFSWPIAEILADAGSYRDVPKHAKVLTGPDAAAARALWAELLTRTTTYDGLPMVSAGRSYKVYFRDELAASFATELKPLEDSAPVAACDPARLLTAHPIDPALYERNAVATLPAAAPCGTELCWDGTFDESSPVQAHLSLQTPPTPLTCLGQPYLTVSADLSPLIDGFRAGYPGVPVEIELGFGTLLELPTE